MEPFIIILFFAILISVLVFGHLQAKKRRQMLSDWAHATGLMFDAKRDRHFDDVFPLPCFRRGHSRHAYNLCSGERAGYAIVAGDYRYTTGSGKNKKTHDFSFFLFQPVFPLRKFALRPEYVFDKFTAAFGFDDIDFESAEFSKAFHVKCEDRKWAYDVLHPRTMEILLHHRELHMQGDSGGLSITSGRTWGINQFEFYANIAAEFLDGIPKHARELSA